MNAAFRRADRSVLCVAICLLAWGGSGCLRHTTPDPPALTRIRLSTGPTGGGFYPLGEGLARAYSKSLVNISVVTQASTGAVANVEAVERNEADVAFTFADVAYLAYGSGLTTASTPYTRLRGIAVLQLTPLHFVVRAGSGIKTIADLRNRRVSMGPPGTGTSLIVQLLLEAFGVPLSTVQVDPLPFNEAALKLNDGTLDAMFDNAIYPAESARIATIGGGQLLPLVGSPIERLRHEYPFFRTAVIPRNSYPGMTEVIHTIGVDSLLICRKDLDESVVYELTKHFFEALPALSSSLGALRFMDLDESPATPIPLHDGAARYYRERELLQ
jgi:TRAP transporter TAXI family solute receptor